MTSTDLFATYSVVAADADEIGAAVQTHQMSVGSIVPWVRPGMGAVATQSLVNISLGPMGIGMLEQGVAPDKVAAALESSDMDPSRRQFAVVNAEGAAAAFTGSGCIRYAGHRTGAGYSVQANMMLRDTVVDAMAEAFESNHGPLAERMLGVLEAAQEESGDIRGMQSAAVVVVANDPGRPSWERIFDLRVDEASNPLAELARLVRLRRAQLTSNAGDRALGRGETDLALETWAAARDLAPEHEEIAFWQAVTLADSDPAQARAAADILASALVSEPSRRNWLDLIDRLGECGLIKTRDLRNVMEAHLQQPE